MNNYKKSRFGIIVLMILISVSCKQNKKIDNTIYIYNGARPFDELVPLVMQGDTIAYEEMNFSVVEEDGNEGYFLYSLIMANKYNYHRAYFEVFRFLIGVCQAQGIDIDEETKDLALKYLYRGVDLNDCQSIEALANLYIEGKLLPKDVEKGKMLLKRAELCYDKRK